MFGSLYRVSGALWGCLEVYVECLSVSEGFLRVCMWFLEGVWWSMKGFVGSGSGCLSINVFWWSIQGVK